MRKLSFFILSLLIFFSYLYFSRDDNLLIYSKLEERYINTSLDTFDISLYSNNKNSIYNNPNYLSFSFFVDNSNLSLSLIRIDNEIFNNLYVYKYVFSNDLKIDGRYNDLKFKVKNYNETLIFNLGNYYFKPISAFISIDENIVLNKLFNISKLNLTIDKSYLNSKLKININNLYQEFELSLDLTNENYLINVNTKFMYDANCILLEFVCENESNYFVIEKNMPVDTYLVLGDVYD